MALLAGGGISIAGGIVDTDTLCTQAAHSRESADVEQ